MKNLSLFICLLLLFAGCSQNSDTFFYKVEEIQEDYSNIENPEQRWNAYDLSDYAIEQFWVGEGSLGNISGYVIAGKIKDVDFGNIEETARGDQYLQNFGKKDYERAKDKVITVDEAFSMIREYQENERYTVEVIYHPRFGFPETIDIDLIQDDQEVQIADADIKVEFKNLKRIVR